MMVSYGAMWHFKSILVFTLPIQVITLILTFVLPETTPIVNVALFTVSASTTAVMFLLSLMVFSDYKETLESQVSTQKELKHIRKGYERERVNS